MYKYFIKIFTICTIINQSLVAADRGLSLSNKTEQEQRQEKSLIEEIDNKLTIVKILLQDIDEQKLWRKCTDSYPYLLTVAEPASPKRRSHDQGNVNQNGSLASIKNITTCENKTKKIFPPSIQIHMNSVNALAAVSDGRLISGSGDKTVKISDFTKPENSITKQVGEHEIVTSLAILPNARVASGYFNTSTKIWNYEKCTEDTKWEKHRQQMPDSRRAYSLAAWDRLLFSGNFDGSITKQDVEHHSKEIMGKNDLYLTYANAAIKALILLQNHSLASACNNIITIWDARSKNYQKQLNENADVFSLAEVNDNTLASGCADGTIKLWDLRHFTSSRARLHAHTGQVLSLARLHNGMLASGSSDHTVRLWNPTSEMIITSLISHSNKVTNLTSINNDGILASGSVDRTIRLWPIDEILKNFPESMKS